MSEWTLPHREVMQGHWFQTGLWNGYPASNTPLVQIFIVLDLWSSASNRTSQITEIVVVFSPFHSRVLRFVVTSVLYYLDTKFSAFWCHYFDGWLPSKEQTSPLKSLLEKIKEKEKKKGKKFARRQSMKSIFQVVAKIPKIFSRFVDSFIGISHNTFPVIVVKNLIMWSH